MKVDKYTRVYVIFFTGLLADEVGSYEPAFYMTGTVILIGASVIFLIPLLRSPTQSREAVFEELIIVEKCTVV